MTVHAAVVLIWILVLMAVIFAPHLQVIIKAEKRRRRQRRAWIKSRTIEKKVGGYQGRIVK